jgi:hypothetical protein
MLCLGCLASCVRREGPLAILLSLRFELRLMDERARVLVRLSHVTGQDFRLSNLASVLILTTSLACVLDDRDSVISSLSHCKRATEFFFHFLLLVLGSLHFHAHANGASFFLARFLLHVGTNGSRLINVLCSCSSATCYLCRISVSLARFCFHYFFPFSFFLILSLASVPFPHAGGWYRSIASWRKFHSTFFLFTSSPAALLHSWFVFLSPAPLHLSCLSLLHPPSVRCLPSLYDQCVIRDRLRPFAFTLWPHFLDGTGGGQ